MTKNRTRQVSLLLAIIILLALGIGLFYWDSQGSRPPGADAMGGGKTSSSSYDPKRFMPILKETVRVDLKGADAAAKCEYNIRYDKKTGLYDVKGWRQRNDAPQVEFRFTKGGKKHRIKSFTLLPFKDGKYIESWPCERSLCYGADEGFYVCRVPVIDESKRNEDGSGAMVPGRSYLIQSTEEPTVPKPPIRAHFVAPALEPATIAVYEVNLDLDFDHLGRWKQHIPILLQINNDPKYGFGVRISDPGRTPESGPINFERESLGRYTAAVRQLGGQLVVADNKLRRVNHVLYYIGSVNKAALELPRDADLFLDPDKLVQCECRLPGDFPSEANFVWLLVERDDQVPIAWAKRIERKDDERKATVKFSCVPGRYYVAYLASNKPVPFGQVTIPAMDSGKVVNIERIDN